MGEAQADLKNREKSPQSKFFDKIQNSVDKIDKKMKQIQVYFISLVHNDLLLESKWFDLSIFSHDHPVHSENEDDDRNNPNEENR